MAAARGHGAGLQWLERTVAGVVALALPVSAGSVLLLHSTVTLIGHVIVGAWLSSTVMV